MLRQSKRSGRICFATYKKYWLSCKNKLKSRTISLFLCLIRIAKKKKEEKEEGKTYSISLLYFVWIFISSMFIGKKGSFCNKSNKLMITPRRNSKLINLQMVVNTVMVIPKFLLNSSAVFTWRTICTINVSKKLNKNNVITTVYTL